MAIEKVGWEYMNGLSAFNNLINMIEVAIQAASLRIYQKVAAWEYKGFYLEDKEFWCGISYTRPLVMLFEIQDKTKLDAKAIETRSPYPVEETKDTIFFVLELEKVHFFSLDKSEQLDEIANFVRGAYSAAQQMRVKSH